MRNLRNISRRSLMFALAALVVLAAALGGTVLRGPAMALADGGSTSTQKVLVTNTTTNPVPVKETNTDANGNIKVHEQGTANVNVTNTTGLPVTIKNLNTDTNGNLKVAEQGNPNVNVQNFPSSQTVNGSVSVSNFPDAPTTTQIEIGGVSTQPGGGEADLFNGFEDVSAYREVTLYLFNIIDPLNPPTGAPTSPGLHCTASTQMTLPGPNPPPGPTVKFDEFDTGTATYLATTFDPAPANIKITCQTSTSDPIIASAMLVGRTG